MSEVILRSKKVYKHLKISERDELSFLLSQGFNRKEIAEKIGRHPSTISRELKKNGSAVYKTDYRPNRAQLRADERKKKSHQKQRLKNDKIRNYVEQKLKCGWTPEIIAGRIRIEMPGCVTNHESIYMYIYSERRDLIKYLPRGNRVRRKRAIKQGKRMVKIPNRVMIDHRPAEINNRERFGDWEADTVVSRQSKASLAVIRERKFQLMFINKIERKDSKSMRDSVIMMMKRVPKKFRKSVTFDNGLENALHESIGKKLKVQTYFCNAYHSWEKGGVENGIGLIRRYLPKKTNFALISDEEIIRIESELNNRPRKSLGFLTPLEYYRIALNH